MAGETEEPTKTPPNIAEFNTIVGHVFAQLYERFPLPIEHIQPQAIASAMGISSADWANHVLPSGRTFNAVLVHTLNWLTEEEYIRSLGPGTYERVGLTQKGLAALNAVPKGLSASVGTSLVMATGGSGSSWSSVGDLVGSMIGGFTRSISGP
jgi:hypothetical protein